MTKAKVSDDFLQFETRNTNSLKKAREEDKKSRGNPLPVGYNGVGVISDCAATSSKAGAPYGLVEVTVINDPDYEGKTVPGAIRTFKDSQKQTAAEAYGNFLDDLEDMGLKRETRENSSSIADMFNELLETPHYVSISVTANSFTRDGKQVKCYAVSSPNGDTPPRESAEGGSTQEDDSKYKDCKVVKYLGIDHYMIEEGDNDTYTLVSCRNKKMRENIAKADIEFGEG